MKINIKDIAKPAIPLIIICLSVSLVLSLTNLLTKDRIAQLVLQNEAKAMSRIFSDVEFTKGTADVGCDYYLAGDKGYVFTVKTSGYGGEISVMVGVNSDKTVKGIEIIDVSSETVGLGQNAATPEFTSSFKGLKNGISVVINGATGNQINALTGATISSQAVTDAVNQALDYADKLYTNQANEGGEP